MLFIIAVTRETVRLMSLTTRADSAWQAGMNPREHKTWLQSVTGQQPALELGGAQKNCNRHLRVGHESNFRTKKVLLGWGGTCPQCPLPLAMGMRQV